MIEEKEDFYNMSIKEIRSYAKYKELSIEEFKKILIDNKRFIPMCFDSMFKTFMSSSKSIDYLVEILSYATKIDKSIIKENMSFTDPFNKISNFFDKSNTSDMKIKIGDNYIVLEMNTKVNEEIFYKNRIGMLKEYSNLDDSGRKYNSNRNIYLISFDYGFIFDIKSNILKSDYSLYDFENNIKLTDNIHEVHLLLENLEKMYYTRSGKLRKDINIKEVPIIDRLLLILSCSYYEDLDVLYEGLDKYMESKEKIEGLTEHYEAINKYWEEHEAEWWENTIKYKAEKEGFEQGEKKKEKELIQNMLNNNLDIETIAKYLNMDINKVKALIDEK